MRLVLVVEHKSHLLNPALCDFCSVVEQKSHPLNAALCDFCSVVEQKSHPLNAALCDFRLTVSCRKRVLDSIREQVEGKDVTNHVASLLRANPVRKGALNARRIRTS
ncbi:hypothetical protein CLOM_g24631 [Closterium sp. NIES-68]|nr:hypothetical protein CLOM_g24631 [Closterium sp. NIES-68]